MHGPGGGYLLQKEDPNGNVTYTAHPGKYTRLSFDGSDPFVCLYLGADERLLVANRVLRMVWWVPLSFSTLLS